MVGGLALAFLIVAARPELIRGTGGGTRTEPTSTVAPMPAYRALATQRLRHDDRLHVLFSDERYVPADSSASNYPQAGALLEVLALPPDALLQVRTELPLDEAAADYERELTTLLSSGVRIGLGLLGLGADGHTASLFSLQDLARVRGRYAIPVQRPDGMTAVSPDA